MRTPLSVRQFIPCVTLLLAACATSPTPNRDTAAAMQTLVIESTHFDDLLSDGLGLDGLRVLTPPAFANPAQPTSIELRRRAIWTNWRGIADLAPGGGYGELYGSLVAVPGREFHALMRLPDAEQPHRVMLQVPDEFDAAKRCLVVTASSGSRGIYGAISLAGAWGLPRGCAVAYTDKGAGTDWVESGQAKRHTLDGTLSVEASAASSNAAFEPTASKVPSRIAYKHAHSQDNPEADWGRHVKQAAEFGLHALSLARPDEAPFTFDNTRVIATGLSNGGGAVLRAAEQEAADFEGENPQGEWLDGVVVIAPNVWPGEGGRPLYDYATEAALTMPCALLHSRFDAVAFARPGGKPSPEALKRCASLGALGGLKGDTVEAQAKDALDRLHASGWGDGAIEAGAISVAFDIWRVVGAAYASAYTRSAADTMPCGYAYAALDAQGQPRAATIEERAAWWSDASGIPQGAGVALIETPTRGDEPGRTSVPGSRVSEGTDDSALPGLRCLRALWESDSALAKSLRTGVYATRASLPRADLPMIVVHGADDGLVPEAFSGGAYARWANAHGRDLRYWRVANAQHFDAFLGLPPLAGRYVPLLPYAYRALDAMWAHIADGAPLPASAEINAIPRMREHGAIPPLTAENLALP